MANDFIEQLSVNSDKVFDLRDAVAIKKIKYGSGSDFKDILPDADGTVVINKTVLNIASNNLLGGVKIANDTSATNIKIDSNGFISALIPIKKIKDPDGQVFDIAQDFSITLKGAKENSYGLCKTNAAKHISVDENGCLYTSFGEGTNTFKNVVIETSAINFESEYNKGTFNKQ